MPDALSALFEGQQRAMILERHAKGPNHIEPGDLQHLTEGQVKALRHRAYTNWMRIAVTNTCTRERYRLGLDWRDVSDWCTTELARREAEGRTA